MKLPITIGVLLTVVLISSLATSLVVVAQEPDQDPGEVTLEGDGVVEYDWSHRPPIENGVLRIIQGTQKDDACVFNRALSLSPNEQFKISRTLAFNPDTCQELIEVGTMSSEARSLEDQRDQANESIAVRPLDSSSQHDMTLADSSLPRMFSSYKAKYEDPVNWDVNWLSAELVWEYDDENDIVNYVSDTGWCRRDWNEVTDWYPTSGLPCDGSSEGSGSRYVVETSSHFENTAFICFAVSISPFLPPVVLSGAKTHYEDQELTAYADGTSAGQVNQWKEGECAWLLHGSQSLVREPR